MCFKLDEQSTKFLLFAYLGVYDGMEEKPAITKCAKRAYLDMCRTLKTKQDGFGDEYSKRIAKIFCDEGSLEEKKQASYKLFFDDNGKIQNDLNNYLETKSSANSCFYYGQAQKWINMTLKYMWLIGLVDDPDVENLEVPIDKYIMEEASTDLKVKFPKKSDRKKYGDYCENDSVPWSKLSKDEYDKIQTNIRNGIKRNNPNTTPIQWEYDAWLKQAKE